MHHGSSSPADRQGTGRVGSVLGALRGRATASGLNHVIAPVRPALKSCYPLAPMESFARWTREDGLPGSAPTSASARPSSRQLSHL